MLREDLGQARGVVGEMLERHRAVFDEGHRLAVALHGHHDIESCLAHLPERLLGRGLDDLHHAAGKAQIAGELDQRIEARYLQLRIRARELDQQDRLRLADEGAIDDRAKRRILPREIDHRAVDELHGGGPERDDVASGLHRPVEAREIHHAERFVRRQRRELKLQPREPGERPFGADQELREIHRAVDRVRPHALRIEHVEVVAADAAQHRWKSARDLLAFARGDRFETVDDRPGRSIARHPVHRAESHLAAIGEDCVDGEHVVHHVAVLDRA